MFYQLRFSDGVRPSTFAGSRHEARKTAWNRKSVLVGLLALAVLSMPAFSCGKKGEVSSSPESAGLKAMVTFVKGNVAIESNGVNTAAKVDSILKASDVVITGPDSGADLVLQDHGLVKLAANTRLKVLTLTKGVAGSNAEIKISRGAAAAFINRKSSRDSFRVTTPTAIAGVRGTAFLIEVAAKPAPGKKNQRVKIAVASGSVAVNLPGQDEIILDKNSQLVIDGFEKLTRDMVRTLSPESLKRIKSMAVFHKSNVLEFNNMVEDIRQNTAGVLAMEGGNVNAEMKARERKISKAHLSGDTVSRAAKTDGARYMRREVNPEHIKLKPVSGFKD